MTTLSTLLGMDWPTLLAAAALSGVVSWLTARHVAIRQTRATTHEDARRELRALVAPTRRKVAQYRADMIGGRKRNQAHTEDAALAGRLLAVADRMPWWRRRLVRRRVRRLVGPAWFDLAQLHEAGTEEAAFEAWLVLDVAGVRARRRGENVERTDDLGLMHRALCGPRSSGDLDRLEGELRRLASGW